MPRIGPNPKSVAKRQIIREHLATGVKSVRELIELTGYSKAVIYRALRADDVQLERKSTDTVRPFLMEVPTLEVDPYWAAEFRGFFYGEGYIDIQGPTQNWRPIITINLRADDEQLLRVICLRLGGCLAHRWRDLPEHPQCRWNLTGWGRVKAVIEQTSLLDQAILPSKKLYEVRMVYSAIQMREQMPYHPSKQDQVVLQSYHDDLIRARMFKSG
jgi:hypothetical protein